VTFTIPGAETAGRPRFRSTRALGLVTLLGCFTAGPLFAEATHPNVVILMADDLGWRDLGYHGSEIETPHIDRMAEEGIALERFYVLPGPLPLAPSI